MRTKSVLLSLVLALNFEYINTERPFSVCRYVSKYLSQLYMNVTESSLISQEQKLLSMYPVREGSAFD